MKVAILSDIHDHIDNLKKVLSQINEQIEAVISLGDMCAPFTAQLLSQANVPIYACLGNNDEDQIGQLIRGGKNYHWTFLAQEFTELDLGGRKITFCHLPKLGELLAKTGDYDAAFHGHTHVVRNEIIGKTLLLNPGAVCGINPKAKTYEIASFALYDTSTNTAEIIKI